ncbi:unnamed protein product [Cylindrotheca closterium]|uniref:Uncharacterized protein n=1 Tax=Cylindrotheca closterium TaxID=2856 RepID=A0AAD2FFH3_9STRA|nr:unnamed protein product [Cylindrotheca closterium]
MPSDPPLLATDQYSETPNLGPAQSDLEQSPLERLIQQSTSEQQQQQQQQQDQQDQQQEIESSSSSPQFFLEEGPTSFSIAPPAPLPQTPASMFLTLGAASLCLLHAGLLWASFLSSAWFETHLRFTVDWLDGTKDTLLHTSTLSSLLSEFLEADLNGAAVALLLTSMVLPCMSMILTSGWTISDHANRAIVRGTSSDNRRNPQQPFKRSRPIVEWMLRLSLATVFSLSILDVAIVSISLIGNGSDVRIVNRTSNGMSCYTLGMVLGLIVIGVLRWAKTKTSVLASTTITTTSANTSRVLEPNATSSSFHAPPSHAFQLPWTRSMDSDANNNSSLADQTEPLLPIHEEFAETTTRMVRQRRNAFAGLPTWKKIVLYETSLGATFLLIPALFLPLFSIKFGGLASQFIEDPKITFHFWQFPKLLHNEAYLAETKHWIMVSQGAFFFVFVYIVPLVATFLAIGTWRSGPATSKHCYRILYIIQPCLCSLVFAISVLVAVPAFRPLVARLLSNKTSGICTDFHLVTNDNCLTMEGQPRLGVWFLFAQSLSLETLVILTLIWRKS